MKHLVSLVLLAFLYGCSNRSGIDKHLRHSDNVLNVKELVYEIVIDTPLVGMARPYVLGDYFILADRLSEKNQILLFDKKDFSYITGTGHPGEGPNQITRLGELIPDSIHQCIYVADYGKMKILGYDLNRILTNSDCVPTYRFDLNKAATPVMFSYVNDTLCYACCIVAEPGKHFQESLVTWNMKTGDIHTLVDGHPEVERKRFRYAVSLKDDLIAVSYDHHDLLAIYNLKGELKHYIYGPNWDNATNNAMIYYYGSIIICNNRIIVGYSGERNPDAGNISVSKLLVYDLEGNYIKTLDVGYNIGVFCYDSEYNRIIMVLDDEIQFGYLELNEIL
ncbi:6-bladed beta-propeller [uncultured Bacteroides sp.]|uniref:6-bladed beta-propeller n=1 Tax=uncultured Bacteroides sp. TaxID=162156 RepID=UPI0025DEE1C1|nr:6-bladed beta-propeller [uncultured Bacteroides sp.]